MKLLSIITILSLFFVITSCYKQRPYSLPVYTEIPRNIQFLLYTDKDLSDDNRDISFTVLIQDATLHTLWDSVLAPMKIKNIPDFTHKLVINRTVPNNNNSLIRVGFHYVIGTGENASFFDSSNAGEKFKVVNFNFQ